MKLLPLLCFIVTIAIITSCQKNKDVTSGKVELLSFGPTGAKHGDTISFIGNNLTKVTSIALTGAVVPQSSFLQQTATLIKIIVPKETQQGFVTLKTPDGDITSKTQLNLDVTTKITTITPQARPGDNITITGEYLNWVKRVTFARGKVVDSFVSKSMNQLVVKVPADAQTGPLLVAYGGTDSMEVQTKDTLIVTLPAVTSIAPNPVKHGTNLTITGTNLDLVKQIMFKGVDTAITNFVSQSANQIIVKVPAGTQKGVLSVVAASGVAVQSANELDVVLPAITSMSPNPVDPLTNLTITGTNLDLVTSISFTGVLVPVTMFVSQSATQIVVKVPVGTLKGAVTVAVLNSSLKVTSADDLKLNGGLPPLADFPFAIYTDALQNGFQDYSYTDTHDFNNTSNVRQGTKSIKAVYRDLALKDGGYQGITFHNLTPLSTTGYTTLEFSVFGEAGTGGKKLNIVINGDYGHVLQQVTIKEGEWATFSISLSSLGSPATLGEIVLQSAGFGGTLHIDHVGLR